MGKENLRLKEQLERLQHGKLMAEDDGVETLKLRNKVG
jgi:hypothetical protein